MNYSREQRRKLARDNAKLPTVLQPVPIAEWPAYQAGASKIPYAVLRSRFFLVQCYQEHDGISRLSIARSEVDTSSGRWKDGITWEELQDIKRQAGLGDYMAVEIYPKDRDIVNVANMRHLWVLRDPLSFGWRKS
jgi:hypothetical protein